MCSCPNTGLACGSGPATKYFHRPTDLCFVFVLKLCFDESSGLGLPQAAVIDIQCDISTPNLVHWLQDVLEIKSDIPAVLSEYEVVSTTDGPNGHEVSIQTTNQTHTAVENLKPESRYLDLVPISFLIRLPLTVDPIVSFHGITTVMFWPHTTLRSNYVSAVSRASCKQVQIAPSVLVTTPYYSHFSTFLLFYF